MSPLLLLAESLRRLFVERCECGGVCDPCKREAVENPVTGDDLEDLKNDTAATEDDDDEEMEEADEDPLPKHYVKDCSPDSVSDNIRYFVKKKHMPQRQAIAASLNVDRRLCKK